MTLTIAQLLVCGFVVGLLMVLPHPKVGCVGLPTVPVAMLAYIWWWQGQNPDKLRSTSALNFVFGSLWPSLGVRFPPVCDVSDLGLKATHCGQSRHR
jgi:hypothetical protein